MRSLNTRCRDIEAQLPLAPVDWLKCQQYHIAPQVMQAMTEAWSFGIGKDARHESWIRQHNPLVNIQCFDPTTLSMHTIAQAGAGLQWAPIAYHPTETECVFYTTDDARRCYSLIKPTHTAVVHEHTVECADIYTLLDRYAKPNYIKFDVEGMWYELVCDVLRTGVRPYQLVGEFEMYYGNADQQFDRLHTVIKATQEEGYTVFVNRLLHAEMLELAFVRGDMW